MIFILLHKLFTFASHFVIVPFSCPVIRVSSRGPQTADVTFESVTGMDKYGVGLSKQEVQNKNMEPIGLLFIVRTNDKKDEGTSGGGRLMVK